MGLEVQWYPGHMAKARREIREQLRVVDVVVEVIDARIPKSSRNPDLPQLVGSRPVVIAMTKRDLADPVLTEKWLSYWNRLGYDAVALDLLRADGVRPLSDVLRRIAAQVADELRMRGRNSRPLRVLVAGVPNVGKSSLINRLAGRSGARVGAKAGVTRGKQWIRVGQTMQLLDTPGILWPKLEDSAAAFRLAATGAVSDEVYDWQELSIQLAEFLMQEYPNALMQRYGIEALPQSGVEVLEAIGRRRGYLIAGGEIDFEKACRILLLEFRSGKLGPITLEAPEN